MANRKILLVEGPDDEHVLKHICGHYGISHLDEVKPHGSVNQLLESIPVRLKASDAGDAVGVVLDADANASSRWSAVRNRLQAVGYDNVPVQPSPVGTILSPPDGTLLPRFGIWMMPDNKTTGVLEDFLRFLVPQPNKLFDHVKRSVANIPNGERRFRSLAEPKAIIHTWLAWQEDPGKPLGTAVTAGFLNPNLGAANVLASWLRSLFFP